MSIMGKMVRIPAGNTTNEHYNFVVAKPLVYFKETPSSNLRRVDQKREFFSTIYIKSQRGGKK